MSLAGKLSSLLVKPCQTPNTAKCNGQRQNLDWENGFKQSRDGSLGQHFNIPGVSTDFWAYHNNEAGGILQSFAGHYVLLI